MSKIIANIDINSKTIRLDKQLSDVELGSEKDRLEITLKLTEESSSIAQHYTCGFYVFNSEQTIIQEFKFPPAGTVSMISPTATIGEIFEIDYNKDFVLNVWAQNNGERFDKDFPFKTHLPPQPYGSWTWNGNGWVPPVPEPTDKKGAAYAWSEKLKKWVEIVPPLSQYDDIL